MNCLNDIKCGTRHIVGIRDFNGCNSPESGLWINDIPGITLKNAASIANEEVKTGYELLKNIIYNATLLTFNDFVSQISSEFSYNAIDEIRKIKYWDGSVLPVSASDRGLVLKRWRSEMAQIYVQEVYGKSATAGTSKIKIIDGSVTKEYDITFVANEEVTVRIDYMANSESIRIVSDNTNFQMYSGPISQRYTGCGGCGGGSDGFYMTGWNGTAEEAKYFGLGVFASVRCNEQNIICQLLKQMGFMIWYRAGAMYYDELISSNRLNAITVFNKALAVDKKAELEEKYEKAYTAFIPTIKTMIFKTKGECMPCNPSIKYANTIP